jgi:hypothetical protein
MSDSNDKKEISKDSKGSTLGPAVSVVLLILILIMAGLFFLYERVRGRSSNSSNQPVESSQ